MFRVELFRVNPITDQANQATNQANQDLERLDQVEDENVLSEKMCIRDSPESIEAFEWSLPCGNQDGLR